MLFVAVFSTVLCFVTAGSSTFANNLPKFTTPLPYVDVLEASAANDYTVYMNSFYTQILPSGYPMTKVYGYSGMAKDAVTGVSKGFVNSHPGLTLEATRDVELTVKWVNNISEAHMFGVDPTLHWANPNKVPHPSPPFSNIVDNVAYTFPIPLVPHLHGAEINSDSDGHPNAWFTFNGIHGEDYDSPGGAAPDNANYTIFRYPNAQPAGTLWYHDHALGMTRLNVVAGLSGFYLLKDPADTLAPLLPSGKYDVPLLIQDKQFNETDGSLMFPVDGINPAVHPLWRSHFAGDVIVVNGKSWPNLDVDRGQYMFRILDGANARFFNISLAIDGNDANLLPFTVIGSDGGYLRAAVTRNWLLLAPSDRFIILADFSSLAVGTKVVMKNSAMVPFPNGVAPDPNSTALIMQFTVLSNAGFVPQTLPAILNADLSTYPSLPAAQKNRTMVLWESVDETSGLTKDLLLDGMRWSVNITEYPEVNATEDWTVINLTGDAHPIHLHLVQFQQVHKQAIDVFAYRNSWIYNNGEPPLQGVRQVDPASFLMGEKILADPVDQGWSDTVHAETGFATTFRIRFSPISGAPSYPFDSTKGPGFVWHCHILDHEDNEMMRPYKMVNPGTIVDIPDPIPLPTTTPVQMTTTAGAVQRDCVVHNVTLGALAFIPSVLTDVQIGDQVDFVWTGTARHNVMSIPVFLSCTGDGVYDSGDAVVGPMSYRIDIGSEFGFTSDKDYFFACLLHCFLGMRGVLQVKGTCNNPLFNVGTTSSAMTTTTTSQPPSTSTMGATVTTTTATSTGLSSTTTSGLTTTPSAGAQGPSPALGAILFLLIIVSWIN